jgi:hypothetical protein
MSFGVYSTSNRNEYQNIFLEVWRGRLVRLTILPSSMTRLFRQCLNFDIWQLYRPPRPVTESFTFLFCFDGIYYVAVEWLPPLLLIRDKLDSELSPGIPVLTYGTWFSLFPARKCWNGIFTSNWAMASSFHILEVYYSLLIVSCSCIWFELLTAPLRRPKVNVYACTVRCVNADSVCPSRAWYGKACCSRSALDATSFWVMRSDDHRGVANLTAGGVRRWLHPRCFAVVQAGRPASSDRGGELDRKGVSQ